MMAVCDLKPPYRHETPMHHAAVQVPLDEWPDECIWWQLKSERYNAERPGDSYSSQRFLANLKAEWESRQLCSRCCREIDQPLTEQFAELKDRVADAENKLSRIRKIMMEQPDITLRPEVAKILSEH
jgi:uncharacterized metal-binding protein YceD (DUF177 family)